MHMKNAFISPITFRERDKRVAALFQGNASTIYSSDLYRADFGEFPLKGIETNDFHDWPVLIKTHFADKKTGLLSKAFMSVTAAGYVDSKRELPELFINNIIHSPLGHLIGFASGRGTALRAKTLTELCMGIGTMGKMELASTIAQVVSSARYQTLAGIAHVGAPSIADTVGHEHVHVRQFLHETKRLLNMDKKPFAKAIMSQRDENTRNDSLPGKAAFYSFMIGETLGGYWERDYYLHDCEVQARLHTIMAKNYAGWGRLPVTSSELYDALADAGQPVPLSIAKGGDLTPADQKIIFRTRGKLSRLFHAYTEPSTADLAALQNTLFYEDLKHFFWTAMLPYYHGLSLEYYGDPQGRVKMGFPYREPEITTEETTALIEKFRQKIGVKPDEGLKL